MSPEDLAERLLAPLGWLIRRADAAVWWLWRHPLPWLVPFVVIIVAPYLLYGVPLWTLRRFWRVPYEGLVKTWWTVLFG